MTAAISDVCSSGPACPTVVQGIGDQATEADVVGLLVMFPLVEVKVVALSTASPKIVREVGSELTSSAWNWIKAF